MRPSEINPGHSESCGFVTDRVEHVVRGDRPPLGEPISVTKLQVHDHPNVVELQFLVARKVTHLFQQERPNDR